MEYGHFNTAKRYIIYRQERKHERNRIKDEVKEQLEKNTFKITKAD
jgi:hypothetical protein